MAKRDARMFFLGQYFNPGGSCSAPRHPMVAAQLDALGFWDGVGKVGIGIEWC